VKVTKNAHFAGKVINSQYFILAGLASLTFAKIASILLTLSSLKEINSHTLQRKGFPA
jgi:hypothetical protein